MADSNNFRVGEYRIGFSQRPNVPRQSNQAERFISLWPDPSYAGAKQSASLLFFVNLTVGVGLNQATQLIVAFPYEDFEPVCQMLRAED